MKKDTWAWVIGIAVFFAVAGAWVVLLPKTLSRVASGHDQGLASIMSSFGQAQQTASSDLSRVQDKLEAGLKNINSALNASNAQAAAISDLRQRLDTMAKESAQTANAPVNTNTATGSLKPSDKTNK